MGVRTEQAGSAVVVVMDWPERRNALWPEDAGKTLGTAPSGA
jgi:hypothetical protein